MAAKRCLHGPQGDASGRWTNRRSRASFLLRKRRPGRMMPGKTTRSPSPSPSIVAGFAVSPDSHWLAVWAKADPRNPRREESQGSQGRRRLGQSRAPWRASLPRRAQSRWFCRWQRSSPVSLSIPMFAPSPGRRRAIEWLWSLSSPTKPAILVRQRRRGWSGFLDLGAPRQANGI